MLIMELFWSVATMVSVPFRLLIRCKPRSLPGVSPRLRRRTTLYISAGFDIRSPLSNAARPVVAPYNRCTNERRIAATRRRNRPRIMIGSREPFTRDEWPGAIGQVGGLERDGGSHSSAALL